MKSLYPGMLVTLILTLSLLLVGEQSYAQGFRHEFNNLPSAEGATYIGNVAEASAFSVSDGRLSQNTITASSDVLAFYQRENVFNQAFPATLEWRARLLQCDGACEASATVTLIADNRIWQFTLAATGIKFSPAPGTHTEIAALDTSVFHTYRVIIPPGSPTFQLSVDGTLVYSGNAFAHSAAASVWWGDGTPTGGNAQAEWDYLSLVNPLTNPLTTAPSLNSARGYHTATLLQNGKVLMTGGENGASPLASVELYDPATNTWAGLSNMAVAHSLHTATLLRNGKVLVVSGNSTGGNFAGAEMFDPGTNTWSAAGSLVTPRARHLSVLLKDGKVLVFGGQDGGGTVLNSAEIYDPATNVWSVAGDMNVARRYSTAVLLPNGKVLVAGGSNLAAGYTQLASAELYDPATNTWSLTGSMSVSRDAPSLTLLPNGKVLVAGGHGENGGTRGSAELYDPATGGWTGVGNLAVPRHEHSATLLPNGNVLVTGGFDPNPGVSARIALAELFDLTTNTWNLVGNFSVARHVHTATLLHNGKVLLAGGRTTTDDYSNAVDLYDASAGSWNITAGLAAARLAHSATLLPNGKVMLAGGVNSSSYFAQVELYDPTTGSWNTAASLNRARQSHTATLLANGKALIAGGYDNTSIAQAELYDPVTDTWTPAGTMLTGRHNHTATLLPDGRVLVAGGLNNSSGEPLLSLDSAELYDPATNTWTAAGTMHIKRRTHQATLLPNGKVLVAGGREDTLLHNTELVSAEIYDPQTNMWSVTGSMTAARIFFTTTLLPNGKVLAVGGYGNGAGLATTEIYDPDTQVWTPAASLNQARNYQTALLMPDGKVLVTGGSPGLSLPVLSSTELFDPATNIWRVTSDLKAARYRHTATLLPDGNVLATGGLGNSEVALDSAELYAPGLGFDNAWRPVLNTVSSLAPGAAFTATGDQFQGIAEASFGATQTSATNYPLIQIRRLDNEQTIFLPVDPTVGWSDTSFTSLPVTGLPLGPALVTAYANGIPSVARFTKIGEQTSITSPPVSQTACVNDSVTLSVTATGSGTLSYQWRKDGVALVSDGNISGATSSTLTISAATMAETGSYDVVVTSVCDSVVSVAATLTVNPLTVITAQPISRIICEGTPVTFAVTATGTNLSYQWRRNGVNLIGATGATFIINNPKTINAGSYDVIVTGDCGTVTSQTATLTVNSAPTITQHPDNQSASAGANVSFTAAATSATPVSVQWQLSVNGNTWTDIAGATNLTLSFSASLDGYRYRAVFTNSCGAETTKAARLRVR